MNRYNLFFIIPLHIVKELARPGTDKIIIGNGCDRYLLKNEFVIPSNALGRILIEELARSFVSFFDWKFTNNLLIQVECEYLKDYVLVRYFSDQNITQKAFDDYLNSQVPYFLRLLKTLWNI